MDIGIKGSKFVDRLTGNPLVLAGSHTWNTVQPVGKKTAPLSALVGNFTRLWTLETRSADFSQSSWGSATTSAQSIGAPPITQSGSLNMRYYRRLEQVVRIAEKRDIVTAVVLFDHAVNAYFPGGWKHHPLNGLGPVDATQVHTTGKWNRYQRAHVKEVTRRLAPYGNVVYEVGNELHRNSVSSGFQKMVVRWIKRWSDKPVGVSYASGLYRDQGWMTRVGADWVVPNVSPRAGGVRKVPGFRGPQVLDTDHGWALRSNVAGLRRGYNLGMSILVMDGLDGYILRNQGSLAPDRDWINQVM